MSSRSSSPTPSNASSDGSGRGGDEDGAARLAQLEALLNASLGYNPDPPSIDEPPKKKRKHSQPPSDDDQQLTAEVAAPAAPTEIAFRLFSTQKTPQTVVIDEEDVNEVVEDPRIRDVADESAATVEARGRNIESIAVSGETIRAQASSQPPSRFANRLTPRLSTLNPATPAPPLAHLTALLHPPVAPTTRPTPTSKRSQRRSRKPQTPISPYPDPLKVRLKVVAVKGVAAVAQGGGRGRKRLSKERRGVRRTREAKEMVRRAMEAVEPGM